MKTILFLLPALQEVLSQDFRQIKYSLFPPLSLLTLAGLVPRDRYRMLVRDEHVEDVVVDEDVDLVVMTVYVSSARRAYQLSDYYRAGEPRCSWVGSIPPRFRRRLHSMPTAYAWALENRFSWACWRTSRPAV